MMYPSSSPEFGVLFSSRDRHDQLLVSRVHPENWKNPQPSLYDLLVIGGGTGGLVAAGGAAAMGAKVALVERRL